jgi:elongation factor P hydroxylase
MNLKQVSLEEQVHRYEDVITIFNTCFFEKYNTELVKGIDEPLYLPADEDRPHSSLIFAHGFFASALHECSHWLIAGENRRKLVDFGYWYVPDGRSASEQKLFQSVEVKPQAMEWILSMAAGFRFRVSIDNLNGSESDTLAFKQAVYEQVKTYCSQGLSERAEIFRRALCEFYGSTPILDMEDFTIEALN